MSERSISTDDKARDIARTSKRRKDDEKIPAEDEEAGVEQLFSEAADQSNQTLHPRNIYRVMHVLVDRSASASYYHLFPFSV